MLINHSFVELNKNERGSVCYHIALELHDSKRGLENCRTTQEIIEIR